MKITDEESHESTEESSSFRVAKVVGVLIFVGMLLGFLVCKYLDSFSHPNPIYPENDYRICKQNNNITTATLTRFKVGDDIPEGCSSRLFVYDSLMENEESMEDWIWANHNYELSQKIGMRTDSFYIIRFQQYWQLKYLFEIRKIMEVCMKMEDTVEQLYCLNNQGNSFARYTEQKPGFWVY